MTRGCRKCQKFKSSLVGESAQAASPQNGLSVLCGPVPTASGHSSRNLHSMTMMLWCTSGAHPHLTVIMPRCLRDGRPRWGHAGRTAGGEAELRQAQMRHEASSRSNTAAAAGVGEEHLSCSVCKNRVFNVTYHN